MPEPAHSPLDRARQINSVDDARQLYDSWAPTYDTDVFETSGIIGSRRVADLLAEHLTDGGTPVVDLGCGTGAVGRRLAEHGFDALTGIDLSSGMLAVASRLGVYDELIEADLNAPPMLPQRFGASISAGTFTTGHVTARAVPGLIALLRPGATIAWVVGPALWPSFEVALRQATVRIERDAAEPIGPDTDDVAHMVVGTFAGA